MALDAYVKTNVQGKVTFRDGTATPVVLVCPFYKGDLSITGIRKILNEVVKIEARGRRYGTAYGARTYPSVSLSAFFSEMTNAAVGNVVDFVQGSGAYSTNISVDGAKRPYAIDILVELEGSDFGGNDTSFTLKSFLSTMDYSTAIDGDTLAFAGDCNAITGDLVAGELT